MSWRTTGILFIVLIVVAALVFIQSRRDENGSAAPTAAAPDTESVSIFESIAVENVLRVEIQAQPDVFASYLRESDGDWHMTTPTATLVVSQTLSNSVTGLLNTASRRTFAPEENPLEVYGLADPAREIVIAARRDEQVVRVALQVGNETPAGDAYYVLREGDRRVHLMTKSTLDRIFELATEPPLPETLPTAVPTVPITGTEPITSTTPMSPTLAPSPSPDS